MHDLLNAARRFPQTVSAHPQRYAELAAPEEPDVVVAGHSVVGEEVRVHPWFIDLTRGQVLRHDQAADQFLPL